MPNLLSQLTKDAQTRFLEELNYLNLGEIRGFCSDRGIPYKILAEYPNGKMKATKDIDRKPIVLARVRHYLATGKVGQPTCIPAEIVRHDDPPARPGPRDRLYYRWGSKSTPASCGRSLSSLLADSGMAPSHGCSPWSSDTRRGADARGVRTGLDP